MLTGENVFEEFRFIIEVMLAFYVSALIISKPKKNFKVAFPIGVLIILCISFSFNFFKQYILVLSIGWIDTLFIGWYFLLTLLVLATVLICFSIRFNDALLISIGGYALQHIDYVLINELLRLDIYQELGNQLWLYILITILATCLLYAPFFYLLKKFKKNKPYIMDEKKGTSVILIIFFLGLIASTFAFQFFFRSTTERDTHLLSSISDLFSCLLIIVVVFMMERFFIDKREMEVTQLLYEKEKEQYEIFKGSIDYINVKFHDLKYQIKSLLKDGSLTQTTYDEIKKSISAYESFIETGDKNIDLIITDIALKCRANNIAFSPIVQGEELKAYDVYDIYNLFSNIMMNAIGYVKAIDNQDCRYINFSVKRVGQFLIIKESNYLNENLIFNKEGFPISTQKDKTIHGFGIKSIDMFAKKNNGQMKIKTDNKEFEIDIILPVSEKIA